MQTENEATCRFDDFLQNILRIKIEKKLNQTKHQKTNFLVMVVKYQPQLLWKEFKEYGHLENNDSLEDNMEQKAECKASHLLRLPLITPRSEMLSKELLRSREFRFRD